MSLGARQWSHQHQSGIAAKTSSQIPLRFRIAGIFLRSIFIVALLIVIVHVSMPQSASIWMLYDQPGDLIRLALGLSVCLWAGVQVFAVPKDPHAFRTWFYIGLAAIPFLLICIIGTW